MAVGAPFEALPPIPGLEQRLNLPDRSIETASYAVLLKLDQRQKQTTRQESSPPLVSRVSREGFFAKASAPLLTYTRTSLDGR